MESLEGFKWALILIVILSIQELIQMSKLEFKPEDFEDIKDMLLVHVPTAAAATANAKLNEYLAGCPVVNKYRNGSGDAAQGDWSTEKDEHFTYTHTARLVNVQAIEKPILTDPVNFKGGTWRRQGRYMIIDTSFYSKFPAGFDYNLNDITIVPIESHRVRITVAIKGWSEFEVQPLAECEHPIIEYPLSSNGPVMSGKCGVCGKKLKATWSAE